MQSVVFIISLVNGVLQLIALVLSFSCLQPFLNQKRAERHFSLMKALSVSLVLWNVLQIDLKNSFDQSLETCSKVLLPVFLVTEMFVSQKTEKWKSGILIHNWNNCFLLTNNVVNYVLCGQWQINYFSYVCEYLTYFHSIKQMTGLQSRMKRTKNRPSWNQFLKNHR